jgi:hypothetical protein
VSYEGGHYLLYATRPEPGKRPVILYKDAVVQLARLVVAVGDDPNGAMSMDFVPSGRKSYTANDILDIPRFGDILRDDRPLAVALRRSPLGSEILQECLELKDGKPSKALRERIADLLNQARSRPDLESLLDPADILPETQIFLKAVQDRSRRNRIALDDFFGGSIDKDIEDRYQVVYKASTREQQQTMASMLPRTRVSALWTAADARLKMMFEGLEGMNYAIGPSQLVLCAEEARDRMMRGSEPNYGQLVDYFVLDVDEQDMAGVGEWYRDPILKVRAGRAEGLETPGCATRWSAALSKRMKYILEQQDDPLAADLNALLQILILHRAIVYISGAAPLDIERLDLLQKDAEIVPSTPPNVVKTEIAYGARGKIEILKAAGGVCFGRMNQAPNQHLDAQPGRNPLAGSPSVAAEDLEDIPSFGDLPAIDIGVPRFVVRKMDDGLLQIDITSILAPDPNHLTAHTPPTVVKAGGAQLSGVCGGITGMFAGAKGGSSRSTMDQGLSGQRLSQPKVSGPPQPASVPR